MTEEEINEGNKLIAKFMNYEEGYDEHGVWKKLAYDSSWDWLMTAVDKIENTGQILVFFELSEERIVKFMGQQWFAFGSVKFTNTKIEATFQVVVDFIKKYHNEVKND